MTTERAVRTPRIHDAVIAFEDRATIVNLAHGFATIDGEDLRVTVAVERLRWDPLGAVWLILASEPPEPLWLHESPEYADPVTAAKAEADRA